MKTRNAFVAIGLVSLTAVGAFATFGTNKRSLLFNTNNNDPYSLHFNSSNRPKLEPQYVAQTVTMKTSENHDIAFTYRHCLSYELGHTTLKKEVGQLYNPYEYGSEYHNRITGIASILVKYNGSTTLSISYGGETKAMDDEYDVMDIALTSEVLFNFDNTSPCYFNIHNNTDTDINIESIVLTYTCKA